MKRLLPGLTMLLAASAVGAQSTGNQKAKFSPDANITLGGAVHKNSLLPLSGTCLKKDIPRSVSSLRKDVEFRQITDIESLAKALNIDLSAKIGWGRYAISGAMEYIDKIKGDSYTINLNYLSVIKGRVNLDLSGYYGMDALNKGAVMAYNDSPEHFLLRCGDGYTEGLDMGAILNVNVLVRFTNQSQKRQLEAALKGNVGSLFKASAKLRNELERNHYDGTIEVIAFQGGGNPSYLDKIFGQTSEHPILGCSLQDLDSCTKALDEIINYAQANGKWSEIGFANQVKVKDGHLEADSLYPISYSEATTTLYSQLGISLPLVQLSQEVVDAWKQLNQLYDVSERQLQTAKGIIDESAGFTYLSWYLKDKINAQKRTLSRNLSRFHSNEIMDCYLPGTQDKCPGIVKKLESELVPVSSEYFDLLRDAYYVNVNYNFPVVYVRKNDGTMSIYSTSLIDSGIQTHYLKLTPSADFGYISLGGGYSMYNNGVQTRYYMDYYGAEDFVYMAPGRNAYIGTTPWNTCVNGNCYKANYAMEIVPF